MYPQKISHHPHSNRVSYLHLPPISGFVSSVWYCASSYGVCNEHHSKFLTIHEAFWGFDIIF